MLYEVITLVAQFLDAFLDLGQRVLAGPLFHDDDHCCFSLVYCVRVDENGKGRPSLPWRPFLSPSRNKKKNHGSLKRSTHGFDFYVAALVATPADLPPG